jgi:hypothetical protein
MASPLKLSVKENRAAAGTPGLKGSTLLLRLIMLVHSSFEESEILERIQSRQML